MNKNSQQEQNREATLKDNEFHPSAADALEWLRGYQLNDPHNWLLMQEAIASSALAGNRLSNILMSTINRLDKGEPVSDRYLLGLCWFLIRNTSNHDKN